MQRRVLIILPRIPFPARDGAEVVMSDTLIAMAADGYAVDVFALNPRKSHRDPDVLASYCRKYATVEIDTSLRALKLASKLVRHQRYSVDNTTLHSSYWVGRFIDDNALFELLDFVQANGPYDVIHCETLFTVYYGLALRAIAPCSVVYRSHNVEWRIQQTLASESHIGFARRLIHKRLADQTERYERGVSCMVDAIACISDTDALWYSQLGTEAFVSAIEPGVRCFTVNESRDYEPTIGFIGSLDWEPNKVGLLWFINNVMPIMRSRKPDIRFVIAGRSSESFMRSLASTENICCLGEVASSSEFLADRQVVIAPLFSGSGVRIKLLEAFGMAKAVVTTTLGASGLDVQHGVHCMIVDKLEEFAEACLLLLDNDSLRNTIGNNAHAWVNQRHSWNVATEKLISLYDRVS
ncbi:MAG: glycosyltransferase family 4 protein [Ignavibacteria bacterium]